MSKSKEKKQVNVPWEDAEPSQKEKEDMKDAVLDYFLDKKKDANDLEMTVQLVTRMIPQLAFIDAQWSSVDSDKFRIHKHVRHRTFYDTVRHMLRDRKKLQVAINARRREDLDDTPKGDLNAK